VTGLEAAMSILRIVPNIQSSRFDESRAFYVDFLGLQVGMDMEWIVTFASAANPTAQISIIRPGDVVHPDLSIEVEDVDALYAKAMERGLQIVHPLVDEPWGVRRFFVVDPNGRVVNVMSHLHRNS
jgi:catechol 2,3-dioxygenase-like lactoylglutathione lyase family enzyme